MEDVTQIPEKFIPVRHRNGKPGGNVGVVGTGGGAGNPARLVEEGLAAHQAVVEERDALKIELDAAKVRISELEKQIEVWLGERANIESRISTCVLERDHAVTEKGTLLGRLLSIKAIIESTPLAPESGSGE